MLVKEWGKAENLTVALGAVVLLPGEAAETVDAVAVDAIDGQVSMVLLMALLGSFLRLTETFDVLQLAGHSLPDDFFFVKMLIFGVSSQSM